jgi:biopolymer transport protein ExbD
MAKRSKMSSGDVELDMTPMIDIVFQLITFFLLVNNFEQTEADERVKLPKDSLAKPPEVKVKHEMTLNVGYLRNLQGERTNPAAFLFNFADKDMLPPLSKDTETGLAREARIYKQQGTDPKDVTIRIRSDGDVPTGEVQQLIKLCQDQGYEKFAISARQAVE